MLASLYLKNKHNRKYNTLKGLPVYKIISDTKSLYFQNQAAAVMTVCAPLGVCAYPGVRVRLAQHVATARTRARTSTTRCAGPTGRRTTTSAGSSWPPAGRGNSSNSCTAGSAVS